MKLFRIVLIAGVFLGAAQSQQFAQSQQPTQQSTQQPTSQPLKQSGEGADASQLDTLLKQILQKQADSWNRGDISAFMDAYWRDERLTFSSGGKTTRGWQATRDNYAKNYPDKKTMGTLKFTELEVQRLSDNVALMLGRWHLTREQPVGGNFSLVWQRIDGKWVIIHDHSSSDSPKE